MQTNVYANIYLKISEYLFDIKESKESAAFIEKAIEFENNNLSLNQKEIDDLLNCYKNKSIEIDKAFFLVNLKRDALKRTKRMYSDSIIRKHLKQIAEAGEIGQGCHISRE